ncbi:unnamed protein product, partial [Allacma fusca]
EFFEIEPRCPRYNEGKHKNLALTPATATKKQNTTAQSSSNNGIKEKPLEDNIRKTNSMDSALFSSIIESVKKVDAAEQQKKIEELFSLFKEVPIPSSITISFLQLFEKVYTNITDAKMRNKIKRGLFEMSMAE